MFGLSLRLCRRKPSTSTAAPTLDSVVFTDNNDGTPASLAIGYTGSVAGYRVYLATGDSTFDSDVPTDSELYNETGAVSGVLEYANFAVGTNIDITGLTSTSNAATRVAVRLIKSADGSGTSNAVVETVSGLDFTSPSFSSAEVGTIDADTLEITATETLFGTVDYTDFTLTGNTITAASLVGGKIRLTLGTTATSGDDYTGDLSYSGTGSALVDGDGNALTTFSNQNVTNNVPAAGGSIAEVQAVEVVNSTATTSSYTGSSITVGSGTNRVLVIELAGYKDVSTGTYGATSVSHNGQSATLVGSGNNGQKSWVEHWVIVNPTTGAGTTSITTAENQRAFATTVREFTGVDQTTPMPGTSSAGNGTGTSVSPSHTTANANSYVIGTVSVEGGDGGPLTGSAGASSVLTGVTGGTGFNDLLYGSAIESVPTAGAASFTFSWTNSDKHQWVMSELKAA